MNNSRAVTVRSESNKKPHTLIRSKIDLGLVLAIAPLLFLNGCTGFVKGKSQTSLANFSVSPSSVNFGKVLRGQKSSQSVKVTNTTSAALTIQQATLSSEQFSVSGATLP